MYNKHREHGALLQCSFLIWYLVIAALVFPWRNVSSLRTDSIAMGGTLGFDILSFYIEMRTMGYEIFLLFRVLLLCLELQNMWFVCTKQENATCALLEEMRNRASNLIKNIQNHIHGR